MPSPTRIVITAAVALTGFAIGAWFYRTTITGIPRGEQLARLPQSQLRLAIDVKALRLSGIINKITAKSPEEPDYLQFVKETGFNYKTDLDLVLASYTANETLAFLTGRFEWHAIQQYAAKHGGACKDGICRMPASTPGRHLSFTKIASSLLAFSSSTDSEAVTKLTRSSSAPPSLPPSHPIWFLIPSTLLKDAALPGAAQMLATALAGTGEILIAIGAANSKYEARLETSTQTPEQAAQIVRELQAATTVLKRTMPASPDAQTLSGILSAGAFTSDNAKLTGVWPIEPAFFDALSGTAP